MNFLQMFQIAWQIQLSTSFKRIVKLTTSIPSRGSFPRILAQIAQVHLGWDAITSRVHSQLKILHASSRKCTWEVAAGKGLKFYERNKMLPAPKNGRALQGQIVAPASRRRFCSGFEASKKTAGGTPAPPLLVVEKSTAFEKFEPALLSGASTPLTKEPVQDFAGDCQATTVAVDADNSASRGR